MNSLESVTISSVFFQTKQKRQAWRTKITHNFSNYENIVRNLQSIDIIENFGEENTWKSVEFISSSESSLIL